MEAGQLRDPGRGEMIAKVSPNRDAGRRSVIDRLAVRGTESGPRQRIPRGFQLIVVDAPASTCPRKAVVRSAEGRLRVLEDVLDPRRVIELDDLFGVGRDDLDPEIGLVFMAPARTQGDVA